jgi:ABC-type multidrug transport system fused ATPase/permease subunit
VATETFDDGPSTGQLISRISDDLKTIAKDELELVRGEIGRVAKNVAVEGAVVTFGGLVMLIGFAMLCVAAVVALGAVIDSLALRLVLMAVVYLVVGGVLATAFGLRLRKDLVPDLDVPKHEAKAVIEGVKATIKEEGHGAHA